MLLPWTLIKMTRKFFKMLLEFGHGFGPVNGLTGQLAGQIEVLAGVIKIKTGMFIF